MIQFDEHIFQRGWFNHQLEKHGGLFYRYFEITGDTPIFRELLELGLILKGFRTCGFCFVGNALCELSLCLPSFFVGWQRCFQARSGENSCRFFFLRDKFPKKI